MDFSLFLIVCLSFLTPFLTFFGCVQCLTGYVTEEEFETFMDFWNSLSTLEEKDGMQKVVEILEQVANLHSPLKVSFLCHMLLGMNISFSLEYNHSIIPPRCFLFFFSCTNSCLCLGMKSASILRVGEIKRRSFVAKTSPSLD